MQPCMQAHIMPGLSHHSLLSVGKMCDSGCALTFTANKVTVTHGATTILTGKRGKESGLWRAPLGNTNSAQAAPAHFVKHVYEQKSIQDTIRILTCMLFQPCERHLAQVYSKWSLSNMAICDCGECAYTPFKILCIGQRPHE
jgi:hypothetical protein